MLNIPVCLAVVQSSQALARQKWQKFFEVRNFPEISTHLAKCRPSNVSLLVTGELNYYLSYSVGVFLIENVDVLRVFLVVER